MFIKTDNYEIEAEVGAQVCVEGESTVLTSWDYLESDTQALLREHLAAINEKTEAIRELIENAPSDDGMLVLTGEHITVTA